MRYWLVALTLILSAAPLGAQGERLFYYTDREDAYRSLVAHIDQISVLAPQSYTVDSLGTFFGGVDARVLKFAKDHHVKVMPLVVNEGFNQPALRRFLGDMAAQRRSIDAMVAACRRNGYWGIQFDVENLNELDRDRFTKWYSDAAAALHAAGFAISIAVVHRTDEATGPTAYHRFLQESWRGGYDLAPIGRVSDFV
jgi:spore germination protein YaaH